MKKLFCLLIAYIKYLWQYLLSLVIQPVRIDRKVLILSRKLIPMYFDLNSSTNAYVKKLCGSEQAIDLNAVIWEGK